MSESESKMTGVPATTTPSSEDTILAACSDDEEYDRLGFTFGNFWSPHAADVADLYETISKTKEKVLEYSWKCPGRRNPDQEVKQEIKEEKPDVVPKSSEPEATDFDFEEESTPFMRRVPGKIVPLKTSVKKKTSSLTGILASMERHRIMDQMASEDAPNAPTPTPAPTLTANIKNPTTTTAATTIITTTTATVTTTMTSTPSDTPQ